MCLDNMGGGLQEKRKGGRRQRGISKTKKVEGVSSRLSARKRASPERGERHKKEVNELAKKGWSLYEGRRDLTMDSGENKTSPQRSYRKVIRQKTTHGNERNIHRGGGEYQLSKLNIKKPEGEIHPRRPVIRGKTRNLAEKRKEKSIHLFRSEGGPSKSRNVGGKTEGDVSSVRREKGKRRFELFGGGKRRIITIET